MKCYFNLACSHNLFDIKDTPTGLTHQLPVIINHQSLSLSANHKQTHSHVIHSQPIRGQENVNSGGALVVIFTRYLRFLALDNGVSVHMIMVTIKCGQSRDHLGTMTTVYTATTGPGHWPVARRRSYANHNFSSTKSKNFPRTRY